MTQRIARGGSPARSFSRLKSVALVAAAVAASLVGGQALLSADKPAGKAAKAAKAADAKGEMVPLNLAAGKAATASSYQNDGLKADMAVDGDAGTRWCADGGSFPQWLQVDLGKAEDLTGARVEWEAPNTAYSYKIETSADGKAWSPAADHTAKGAADLPGGDKFDAKGARYVRLTVTGAAAGKWASVKELEVFGTQLVAAGSQKKPAAKAGAAPTAASVKVAPGFDVTMFAVPPEVMYPTTVHASPNGDVFVGIDEQGSLGKEKGRGRVVRLRDKDGDGKADEIITVAKMDHPRGVWVDGSNLYVLHPPFVTKYTLGADGVATGSEVLVSGVSTEPLIAQRGADHTTNGFRVGPDGWMYIAMGDFGAFKATGKDGKSLQMHGGGVVRVRLDGSDIEDYSFGQRNIYDVAVDPFGNVFTRDNTNDGGGWNVRLSHVIPTGNYGYPRLFVRFGDEIVQPLIDYGGGSPCGALWVDEPNMPAIASGLLTVEWGASKVWHHPLTAKGAGYEPGTKQEMFIDCGRPTDIDYDGRGNFFVTSWAGGSFNFSGPTVGYLARVSAKGYKPVAIPDVAKLKDAELAGALDSPSMKVRELVQREILRRGDKLDALAVTTLEALATDGHRDSAVGAPAVKAAAIFTLKLLRGEKANDVLAKLTRDREDAVREVALRALADKLGDKSAPIQPFADACKDKNPRIRLVAAWGLARLGRPEGIGAVLPLVGDADPLVQHVAVNTLVTLGAAEPALAAINPSEPALTTGALRALARMHDPKVVDGLAAKAAATTDLTTKSAIYRALCRLHFKEAAWDGTSWWGTRPDTSGPYYKTAEWEGTAKVSAILEAALKAETPEVVRALVVDMQRHKIASPAVAAYVAAQAKTDPKFRELLVDQLAQGNAALAADQIELLKGVALDEKADVAVRVKAARALSRDAKNAAALDATVDVFAAVLAAEKPAKELADLLDETARDAKYAAHVPYFAKLATGADQPAKREFAYLVLVDLATGKLAKADAKAKAAKEVEAGFEKPKSVASLLRAVGRAKATEYKDFVEAMAGDKNVEVVKAAGYAAGRLGLKGVGGDTTKLELIEKVGYDKTVEVVRKEKGEAAVGKELFSKVGCVGCHTVSADEPPKGPFLGGIAQRYSRAELCESIMKPNAKIAQGFETQWFKTKDDDVIEGFVTREGGDDLELRDAAGQVKVLKKADIAKRGKRETSIMPEGLVLKLSPQDLASLIAYLESTKGK
ncbi:MAG TPA: discoidin domain-containing protein [Humisphaera sp.]